MQNAPSFKKQGDWMVGFTMQNAQVGYAHGKKWATVLNGYYFDGELPRLSDGKRGDYKRQSHLLELGLCRYVLKKENSYAYLMGGTGWGYADFQYNQYGPTFIQGKRGGNAHFNKFFLQQALSVQKKRTEFVFSYRAVFMNFRNYTDYYGTSFEALRPFFLEPAITMKRNFKRFGIWYQLQYSLAVSNGEGYNHYVYRSMPTLHAGLFLHMQKGDNKKQ
jgi:hypothetical protein